MPPESRLTMEWVVTRFDFNLEGTIPSEVTQAGGLLTHSSPFTPSDLSKASFFFCCITKHKPRQTQSERLYIYIQYMTFIVIYESRRSSSRHVWALSCAQVSHSRLHMHKVSRAERCFGPRGLQIRTTVIQTWLRRFDWGNTHWWWHSKESYYSQTDYTPELGVTVLFFPNFGGIQTRFANFEIFREVTTSCHQDLFKLYKNSSQLTSQVEVKVKSTGGQSSQNPIMKWRNLSLAQHQLFMHLSANPP